MEEFEIYYSNLLGEPGEPYCAACWHGEADVAAPLEMIEGGDLVCPNCDIVINMTEVVERS